MIGDNDANLEIKILNILFSLYFKKILNIFDFEIDGVRFIISDAVTSYLSTGKYEPDVEMTLRTIIRDMDFIANYYIVSAQHSLLADECIKHILNDNSNHKYCTELLKISDSDTEHNTGFHFFAYYIIGHLILKGGESVAKNSIYVDNFIRRNKVRENLINEIFDNDKGYLLSSGIFERAIDDSGKAGKNEIEISSDFKRKFLKGIIVEKRLDDIIETKSIIKKDLFFNEDNEKQIGDLLDILKKRNFTKVRSRLKKSGMRSGFVCLFSGNAGTGKTETVYQIARETGRAIIKIDMSIMRSKWWGEDEKNVKAMFSNYKYLLQESKIEPILLLNEADAIIGKRLSLDGQSNGAIVTSINAVQNIILDELENFEGILIATTNLTENFDSAFERRFLYRIEFQKPEQNTRAKIWASMLNLPEEDAAILAKKFESYTGGLIENIYRKREVDHILYGSEFNVDQIIELCNKENLKSEKKTIGFIS